MTRRRTPACAALLPLALGVACRADLALEPTIQVSCTGGDDCPEGFSCREVVGRCVQLTEGDTEPPAVLARAVTPEVAKVDAQVRVELTPTEPLAFEPEVVLGVGEGRRLGLQERVGDAWVFGYSPTGGEPQGEAVALTATLTDGAGNVARAVALGTLEFDFTVPVVAGVRADDPTPLARKAKATLELTVSEPLPEPPAVTVTATGAVLPVVGDTAGPTYRFEHTVTDMDIEGPVAVDVVAVDRGGNEGRAHAEGVFVHDFRPPEAQLTLPEEALRAGAMVSVMVALSESLAHPPSLTMSRGDDEVEPERVLLSPVLYSFLHVVVAGEHGTWALELGELSDPAGNVTDPADVGSVRLDTEAPGLTDAEVRLVDGGHRHLGQPVRVEFTTTEPVREPSVVLELGGGPGLPLTLETETPGETGTAYVFSRVVQDDDPERTGHVYVLLEDLVGNLGGPWSAGPVTVDLTPPDLGQDVTLDPEPPLGIGALLQVEVLADEPLADARLEVSPAGTELGLGEAAVRGERARWSGALPEGLPTGTYGLTVTVWDLADNEARLDLPARVAVDADRPDLLDGATVGASPLGPGDELVVTFDSNEPVAEPPRTWVDQAPLEPLEGCTDTHFVFRRVVDEAVEEEGSRRVQAELVDRAGNRATVEVGRVLYDFTPPAVVEGSASVHLVAGGDSLLDAPEAARNGTLVRTVFALTEPLRTDADGELAPAPAVVLRTSGVALDLVRQAGTLFTYEARLEGVAERQEYDEQVEIAIAPEPIRDRAGNAPLDALPLGGFRVDTDPPAAPAVAPADGRRTIVYTRNPWGSEATGGEPTFCLRGEAGAVEPGVTVVVHDGADPATAGEIGRTSAGADGAFGTPTCGPHAQVVDGEPAPLVLTPTDREAVWVTAVDAAGNGTAAEVRDVDWVATLGGKVAGSSRENPHLLEARPWWRPSRLQLGAEDTGGVPAATAGQVTWYDRSPGEPAPATAFTVPDPADLEESVGVAWYDEETGRLALLGDDLWRWDGGRWSQRRAADPEGDGRPAWGPAAYDSARDRAVLFESTPEVECGGDSGEPCRHLWEWDGWSWTWRQPRDPEGDGNPTPRCAHDLAFDAGRGVVVLFGGTSMGTFGDDVRQYFSDTWEWGGRSWARREPADPEEDGDPQPRRGHALAWDGGRGVVVLFGGRGYECTGDQYGFCSRTWEWDGTSWRAHDPGPDGTPPGRRGHAMVWDAGRDRVVLFGGVHSSRCGEGGELCEATWEWDGASWTRVEPVDPEDDGQPAGRVGHRMAYDAGSGRVVLYGGVRDETHAWEDDPVCGEGSGTDCTAVWEWDGASWARRDADEAGARPVAWAAALEYDSARGRAVLVEEGDYGDADHVEVWEWDGASWLLREPPGGPRPPTRYGHAVAFDHGRGRLVLFGGESDDCGNGSRDCGDTMEWTGTRWRRRNPEDPEGDGHPAPRHSHAMAYDSGRGRVVLFGGRSYAPCREGAGRDCAQTWEWDGTSWDARDPVPGPDGLPQARYDHALAYDPGRARTVMVGGRSFAGCEEGPDDFCVHTWEWDGERWTLARPEDPEGDGDPQPRIWPGLVWDEVRQRVVLYGGEQDPAGCGEGAGIDCTFVWEWDGTSWAVRKVADPDGRGLPASYATLAWDAAAGGLLQVDEERTWVMPSVDPARAVPAHALRVRLRAALPSGSAVTLQSVTARWRARGLAWPAGVATPGVELRVWDAGYDVWRPAEPLPGDDPEQIEWTTEDARLLGDLLVGDDLELSLAVLPAAGSTTALPRVETEDAAVTVRYRR